MEDDYKKNFIHLYEEVFTEAECQQIINRFEQMSSSPQIIQAANTDLNTSLANRSDSYIFLETHIPDLHVSITEGIGPKISHYMGSFPGLDKTMITTVASKMQRCYPGQGYHDFHWEQSCMNPTRAIVWLLYLNDVTDGGGETELLNFNERIVPKSGTLLIFPASWPWIHRGNPPLRTTKYIVTGWGCFNA
jgi:hypothetical protein